MIRVLILILMILLTNIAIAKELEKCNWNNEKGIPCITITKTPNTSLINGSSVNKKVFTRQDIEKLGAENTFDVLKLVTGLDYYRNGPQGQTGAIFMRGSESNHTLVLLNGVAINDQSATNGMHDFGQDFLQTVQQVEVYKGSNGSLFGPDAIGGAINFVTDADYTNKLNINGYNLKNNSFDYNTTKITSNDWHLNLKGAVNQSNSNSAKAKGGENDGSKNYQVNLNGNKWISNELKFKSTFYYRDTKTDYDKSDTQEESVTSDNKMYAFQTGFERVTQNSDENIIFHYHNYDRKYREQGKKDKYYSESLVLKGERDFLINENLSFGYGSEYKYDWGNYSTTTFTSQTRGHVKNLGVFANLGYKINDYYTLSLHGRNDDHKETGGNQTYKVNLNQTIGKFTAKLTHSTGLKNPSLYELYGSSSFSKGTTELNAEKSETNELSAKYDFSENLKIESTLYRTRMKDRIKINSSWTAYENKILDTTQEGLENEIIFGNENQKTSVISHFAKSRTDTNGPNSRRPDLSYGLDYFKKVKTNRFGDFDLNLNYRYIGDHLDWTGTENAFVKSVDLVDLIIEKDFYGTKFSMSFSNLLNERYEKPGTYSQDGRKFRIGFKNAF